MKKILITAGAGLLGLNWVLDRRDKDEVHFLLNKRFLTIDRAKGYKTNFENLDELKFLISKIKPSLIINTLGLTDISFCEENNDLALETNCFLPSKFAKIANENKIDFIHISTDHLFNGKTKFSSENKKIETLNFYGFSKAEAEKLILFENPNALIIRTNFFGWGAILQTFYFRQCDFITRK